MGHRALLRVRQVRRRRPALNRGAVYDAHTPDGWRPVVVLTREQAIPLLANLTVAAITSTVRGVASEVPVGREHGLDYDCAVNCDNLFTLPKTAFEQRRGELDPASLRRLRDALMIALDLE